MVEADGIPEVGFLDELRLDIVRCIHGLHAPGGEEIQFWRRSAFRSLFGYIQAWMSVNRRCWVPVFAGMSGVGNWITAEDSDEKREFRHLLAATEQEAWELTAQGLPKVKERKPPFLDLLKANVRLALFTAGVRKGEINARLGGHEWDAVVKATKVRDRLAHPKVHGDHEVSEGDMECFGAVLGWIGDLTREQIAAAKRHLEGTRNAAATP